jgi:maltose alpha-D-glucosyltransferase/alpha-amylase
MSAAHWYRTAVFYELLPRAFRDSNGDGVGDLNGIADRLEYLEWLGVECLWLPPIFDSPLRDGGYDVSDFRSIHPDLGTIGDMANLLDAAHRRGLRIISDLPINHTSDAHPWFQEARTPGSAMRDWYVWDATGTRYPEARIVFLDYETSNWTWDPVAGAFYWHRFYSHQPDLNFDNPDVGAAMLDVLRFWLDLGFDGFRLDAVPYLYERDGTICENLPETHAYLKRVRRLVDEEYGGEKVLLAEANQWPADAAAYFGDGDECHMNFHFPVMPRLYMALAREHVRDIVSILRETPAIPDECQWGVFLRNHDELTLEMVSDEDRTFMWDFFAPDPEARLNLGIRRRLAPLVGSDRRALELLHGLLLSLPGSPVLYYGDEIGMGDDLSLPDRDGVRTPMQWDASPYGGFTEPDTDAATVYPPVIAGASHGPEATNVEAQRADPGSLLNWVRSMLAVRREHPEMGLGSFEILDHGNDAVLAFVRAAEVGQTLVLANVSEHPQAVNLPSLAGRARAVDADLTIDPGGLTVQVGPLEFRWLKLS